VRRGLAHVVSCILLAVLAVCAAAALAGGAAAPVASAVALARVAEAQPCEGPFPHTHLAAVMRSHVHDMQITAPTQFDFTLASLTLNGPATGLRVTTTEPTGFDYVAAGSLCDAPRSIFVLIVNLVPRGSSAKAPTSVTLRIETQDAEPIPTIVQHVDVLANGAPGQNCSALRYQPPEPPFIKGGGIKGGRQPLFGSALRKLTGTASEENTGPTTERVALALDQACGKPVDSDFALWVRQEPLPPPPHP
jgi:hypothetical protein